MKGQDNGNGIGPFDATKTDTVMTRTNVDHSRSLETFARQTTFHCCACYKLAVEFDHATIAKDLMEQALRTATDVVVDSKFSKDDTDLARGFIMKFLLQQEDTIA